MPQSGGSDLSGQLRPRVDAHFDAAAGDGQPVLAADPTDPGFPLALIRQAFPGVDPADGQHVVLVNRLRDVQHNSSPALGGDGAEPSLQHAAHNATMLAHTLAAVAGGDPVRAGNALRHWHYGEAIVPAEAASLSAADAFALRCALSTTDGGREVLGTLDGPPAPDAPAVSGGSAASGASAAQAEMIGLNACHVLRNHFVPHGDRQSPPASMEEAVEWAEEIVQLAQTPDNPEQPDSARAGLLEHNLIAAQALLGVRSADPSLEARAAILSLRSGQVTVSAQEAMRTRLNRMLGPGGGKPSFFSRVTGRADMPVNEGRICDALSLSVIHRLISQLEGALKTAPDHASRLRIAARLAALEAMGDRIGRKGWREHISLGRHAMNKVTKRTEQLLESSDGGEVANHSAWPGIAAECSTLDVYKGLRWAGEEGIDVEQLGLGDTLDALNELRRQQANGEGVASLASQEDAIKSQMLQMEPGSRVVYTSEGKRGGNVTGWMNFALKKAASYVPSITIMPTLAITKGREAIFSMTCDETPEGAYVQIEAGTADRRSMTAALALAAQANVGPMNTLYALYEPGKRAEQTVEKGVVVRVEVKKLETGDTLEAAKEKAALVLAEMTGSEGEPGAPAWDRLAGACFDSDVSVRRVDLSTDTRATFVNKIGILGFHVPFKRWLGVGLALGRSRGRTEAQGSDGFHEVVRGNMQELTSKTTPGVLGNIFPSLGPGLHVGTIAGQSALAVNVSAGVGSWFIPDYGLQIHNVVARTDLELRIPEIGTQGAVSRQFRLDETSYRAWAANEDGTSVPAPPDDIRELPLASPLARGQRMIGIQQDLTPEAADELHSLQETVHSVRSASPVVSGESEALVNRLGDRMHAILTSESSWGDFRFIDHRDRVVSRRHSFPSYLVAVSTTRQTNMQTSTPF
jgi:hypothetical protein